MDKERMIFKLFERNPELIYLTAIILFASLASFIYLIFDFFRRKKEARANLQNDSTYYHQQTETNHESSEEKKSTDNTAPKLSHVNIVPPTSGNDSIKKTVITVKSRNGYNQKTEAEEFIQPHTHSDIQKKTTAETGNPPKEPVNDGGAINTSLSNPVLQRKEKKQEISFIAYQPHNDLLQSSPWSYPYVKMPLPGSVIRIPKQQKQRLRGYMEDNFQHKMEQVLGGCEVFGNHCLPTSDNTPSYEPDISIIVGEKINLYIDVEIDEPYAAIKRTPMHCAGDMDDLRDAWFTDRGWMVIRFSEKQVATQAESCLAFIARTIASIYPSFIVQPELARLPDPDPDPQWTTLQAQRWQNEHYREGYLDIEAFDNINIVESDKIIPPGDFDKQVDQLVQPSVKMMPDVPQVYALNIRNKHPRDSRIQRIGDRNIYLIDEIPFRSIEDAIDSCFPAFDETHWADMLASQEGSSREKVMRRLELARQEERKAEARLHEAIEKYYNGAPFEPAPEFNYFRNFLWDYLQLELYRTEWRIFDEHRSIAGTVDMVTKNGNGSYDIYDWKRSGKIVDPHTGEPIAINDMDRMAIGIFDTIPDTTYNRYCLQQNVHKLILEQYYGLQVRNMYLVVMYPSLRNYYKLTVPEMNIEAKNLLSLQF